MSELVVPGGELSAGKARSGRVSWVIVACLSVLGVVVVMAALGTLLTPHDPNRQNVTAILTHPSSAHWLGTDELGRDVFSRLIVGARTALVGPLIIAAGSMLLGNLLGLLAGYRAGRVDAAIMRWVDLMWAVPNLLVIIIVVGTLGGGYWLAVAVLTVLFTPSDTRVVRGATLAQAPLPYVEAARALGVPGWRIMIFHIWPNVSAVSVANAFLHFAGALVALSGLSFLGLGAPPGSPDWGVMLAEGRPLLFANPVAALAPAGMIVIAATSMNLVGDWLYDWLSSRGATR